MSDALLVLNAGSSSIKYALFADAPDLKRLAAGQVARIGQDPVFESEGLTAQALDLGRGAGHDVCLAWLMGHLKDDHAEWTVTAAGHRIVHGADVFESPVKVTPGALAQMRALSPLAPGHQPHNLAGIQAVTDAWPEIDQVACFDTAFHRSQPRAAQLFPLPRALADDGVLRFGFHGLSYEYVASQLPDLMNDAPNSKVIALHLGSGASLCAMRGGKSVATTMGFTALGGLMMATRSGDLDPGVLLYLLRDKNFSVSELEDVLSHRSGLLGVSGLSSDMRDLLASDAVSAAEAVDLFVDRTCQFVGAMMATLGGADALVFTGGIGENASEIRRRIAQQFAWAGLSLDHDANGQNASRIHKDESQLSVFVLKCDEEFVIARQTRDTLSTS